MGFRWNKNYKYIDVDSRVEDELLRKELFSLSIQVKCQMITNIFNLKQYNLNFDVLISNFELNLRESQLKNLFLLSHQVKKFNETLQHFIQFQILKPAHSIR